MVHFFKNILLRIYCQPFSKIHLFMQLLLLSWIFFCCLMPKGWQTFNRVLIPVAIAGILFATLIDREFSTGFNSYPIPFEKWQRALIQKEYFREMFMNVFLFVPFGLSVPYLLPDRYGTTDRIITTISAALILSAVIEFLQFCLNLGSFETDDILCNALGALVGTLHLLPARLLILMKRCISGTGKEDQ